MNLTAEQIASYTQAPSSNARDLEQPLNDAMSRFSIESPRAVAAFMATIAIESARLTKLEEDLYYKSADRLAEIYKRAFKSPAEAQPYVRNPLGLSKLLYQGYHGRGLIQITWLKNYERASAALGFDYVATPSLVCQPKHAALTAAWYWDHSGCNEPAEAGDMDEVTRRVNGPRKLHLEDRIALYNAAMTQLEAA